MKVGWSAEFDSGGFFQKAGYLAHTDHMRKENTGVWVSQREEQQRHLHADGHI